VDPKVRESSGLCGRPWRLFSETLYSIHTFREPTVSCAVLHGSDRVPARTELENARCKRLRLPTNSDDASAMGPENTCVTEWGNRVTGSEYVDGSITIANVCAGSAASKLDIGCRGGATVLKVGGKFRERSERKKIV
jgi:hypothetical protein